MWYGSIIVFLLDITNVLVHGVGCYLLVNLYRREQRKTTQQVVIMNLAMSELLLNMVFSVRDGLLTAYWYDDCREQNLWTAYRYIHKFVLGSFHIISLSMFYLTLDRLLHVSLHIKYQAYWGVKETWYLLIVTDVAMIIVGLVFLILEYLGLEIWTIWVYATTCLYTTYFIFACVAYLLMFKTYLKSSKNSQINNRNVIQLTAWTLFRNSNFFFPTLLVMTYLMFMVSPTITLEIYYIKKEWNNGFLHKLKIHYYYYIPARFSFLIDALIYVYLQKKVRNLLFPKFTCSCLLHLSRPTAVHMHVQRQDDTKMVERRQIGVRRNTSPELEITAALDLVKRRKSI